MKRHTRNATPGGERERQPITRCFLPYSPILRLSGKKRREEKASALYWYCTVLGLLTQGGESKEWARRFEFLVSDLPSRARCRVVSETGFERRGQLRPRAHVCYTWWYCMSYSDPRSTSQSHARTESDIVHVQFLVGGQFNWLQ